MSDVDGMIERAKIDDALDILAQSVASYYEALISADVQPSLAEQLVRDFSWQWWGAIWAGHKND